MNTTKYPNTPDGFEAVFSDFLDNLSEEDYYPAARDSLRAAFISGWLAAGGQEPRKNLPGKAIVIPPIDTEEKS